jgi:hemolysin III
MWSGGARQRYLGLASPGVACGIEQWDPPLPTTNAVTRRPFGRPAWRGRMHTWAFVVAIPAGVLLIASADRPAGRITAAIYALTLVLLFGTSAAYHRLTRTEPARSVMQRLDHSMIYLLIAGTYAPICLVVLPPAWGIPVLAAVTAMAVLGVTLKLVAFERLSRVSYGLYPVMGWVSLAALPALAQHLSATELWLLFGGGCAYLIGLPVLLVRRPDPWPSRFGYHEVWHLLTVVAAGLHFAAVSTVVA